MNKKIILIILTIILILAGVGVGVYLVQQSAEIREKAAPATTLTLKADNLNPLVGQSVNIDINVNTGENEILGSQLFINFDARRLEALEVKQGTFFINPAKIGPTIDNTTGSIEYTLYLPTGSTLQSGKGTLAIITFRTKAIGPATVSISPETLISDTSEQGTVEEGPRNVLISTTPVTLNILGAADSPSPSPTPTQSQSAASLTPSVTPTPVDGIGGTDESPTPSPTKTPTPTQSLFENSPTPTVETPPLPDSGISFPTVMGVTLGILVIVGSLLLAL